MWLDHYCSPLTTRVCRHIPDDSRYDVLDSRFAALSDDNRWNDKGQPTLYMASDHNVLAVEWARHYPRDTPLETGRRSLLRRIYDIEVRLDHVLDLRDTNLCAALSLRDAPYCFLDKALCRLTASRLRVATKAQAVIVPSLGLLDRNDAWILVLFTDKLPSFPEPYVSAVVIDGAFGIADLADH